jgi:hypothetical protein
LREGNRGGVGGGEQQLHPANLAALSAVVHR